MVSKPKMKWLKKLPKADCFDEIFLFKKTLTANIEMLFVWCRDGEISVADYPNSRVTSGLEDYSSGWWYGPII